MNTGWWDNDIHGCYSLVKIAFVPICAWARTIDEYDVLMPVSYIRVTSQINCGDVTILNQKRLSLATMAKSAVDNYFSRIVCSGHQIVCKKQGNTVVTANNDFGVTCEAICLVTRENYWQIASLVTQKSLFTVTHALFFTSLEYLGPVTIFQSNINLWEAVRTTSLNITHSAGMNVTLWNAIVTSLIG